MEVPHDREHLEHPACILRGSPPVLSAEGDLGDLLSCAEAVVDSATPETPLSQAGVNATAEARLEMGTGLPCGCVDREVGRRREGRRDAAQCAAALAVSS